MFLGKSFPLDVFNAKRKYLKSSSNMYIKKKKRFNFMHNNVVLLYNKKKDGLETWGVFIQYKYILKFRKMLRVRHSNCIYELCIVVIGTSYEVISSDVDIRM